MKKVTLKILLMTVTVVMGSSVAAYADDQASPVVAPSEQSVEEKIRKIENDYRQEVLVYCGKTAGGPANNGTGKPYNDCLYKYGIRYNEDGLLGGDSERLRPDGKGPRLSVKEVEEASARAERRMKRALESGESVYAVIYEFTPKGRAIVDDRIRALMAEKGENKEAHKAKEENKPRKTFIYRRNSADDNESSGGRLFNPVQ